MDKTLEIELTEIRPKVLAMAWKFFHASRLDGDPEDVVQDVLLRLWMARRDGVQIRSAEAWAVSSAKNSCLFNDNCNACSSSGRSCVIKWAIPCYPNIFDRSGNWIILHFIRCFASAGPRRNVCFFAKETRKGGVAYCFLDSVLFIG